MLLARTTSEEKVEKRMSRGWISWRKSTSDFRATTQPQHNSCELATVNDSKRSSYTFRMVVSICVKLSLWKKKERSSVEEINSTYLFLLPHALKENFE